MTSSLLVLPRQHSSTCSLMQVPLGRCPNLFRNPGMLVALFGFHYSKPQDRTTGLLTNDKHRR
ncbi:hypothetical protein E2C01_082517 [Portunus trituberculatus]|uniref:Uncharacterized protein n=1 Tax=Portunus trituberculatus TaxID=210409 RepID=A0A5B7J132_PORTR|nr:hypothetical protein [Portunus trituberculatus]